MLSIATLTAAVARAQENTPGPSAEVARAAEEFFQALDRLDADALGRLMTEGCVSVIPAPGGVASISRSDYLARVRARKASRPAAATPRAWRDQDVRVDGDSAVMTGFTGPAGPDGKLIEEAFVSTFWIRQGGHWRIAHSQRAPAGVAGEAARWNDVFRRNAGFNPAPNALLADAVRGRMPGKALDVGMGQGRNAVYLAELGWDVTGMDTSEVGLAIARRSALQSKVRITPVLQTAQEFDWGAGRWDLVAVIYMDPRGLEGRIGAALKPGGLLVIEGFHRDATKTGPIGDGVVFDTDELKKLFADLEIIRYEEPVAIADYGQQALRLVRLIARKKHRPNATPIRAALNLGRPRAGSPLALFPFANTEESSR
ncbi:methyltransferase domain-containing protein [Singulisphaera sp. PoT]|uniref:methyltransferase domain-containing protein n=1 Tax=Singulisphaera sp. PoT TaxID=3411797 RepID=UPI003BF500D4